MGMAILSVECHPAHGESRFPELISNRELQVFWDAILSLLLYALFGHSSL